MRYAWLVLGCLVSLTGLAGPTQPIYAAETKPLPKPPEDQTAFGTIPTGLSKRISVDFQDTSVLDAVAFFEKATEVKIHVDGDVKSHLGQLSKITLKAKDIEARTALEWVAAMAGLKLELGHRITLKMKPVLLADPNDVKIPEDILKKAELGEFAEADPKPGEGPVADQPTGTSYLRIKFANGDEIEASGPILEMTPELGELAAARMDDPARDNLLARRLPDPLPDGVSLEKLKSLLGKVAPKAQIEYDAETHLLMVITEDPVALRRAAALLRALGILAPVRIDGADQPAQEAPTKA